MIFQSVPNRDADEMKMEAMHTEYLEELKLELAPKRACGERLPIGPLQQLDLENDIDSIKQQ
jgi:hypothetical protein